MNLRKILFITTTLAAFLIWMPSAQAQFACVPTTQGIESMTEEIIQITNKDGEVLDLKVLLADDHRERAAGFQHVCPDVIQSTLILFKYDQEVYGKFHMNNVHAPLEIGFFDDQGILFKSMVMDVYEGDYRPVYGPVSRYQFALEARVGFFAEHRLLDEQSRIDVNKLLK